MPATTPTTAPDLHSWRTAGGITVRRQIEPLPHETAIEPLIDALDTRPGVLLASSYDYPGRYVCYDIGFTDPPLVFTARMSGLSGAEVEMRALNARGQVLLPAITRALADHPDVTGIVVDDIQVTARIMDSPADFPEEARSRQPSAFSAIRAITALFDSREDGHLGLYGAFGYDIALAFERIPLHQKRMSDHRDIVLYLPDRLISVDHAARRASLISYEFTVDGVTTDGLPRTVPEDAPAPPPANAAADDMAPGAYATLVERALPEFAAGNLFEVVPGRVFRRPAATPPSELFRRLRRRNPAPYGFLINLGRSEHLVGASPEMYVRVTGRRIETCPISGTIARGRDAMEDADRIRTLLASAKEEAELTMCTDVDRNDKSRVSVPGSVRIVGRRQIEMYSRLIHTVDHVEGMLAEGYDAIDAFLSHCWAVTVTGAPKRAAMSWIEAHEHSPRAWYGGAIGRIGFDGDMNTGLTLRTIRVRGGIAEVRAGATLLFDSEPAAEEAETVLKASAMIDVLERPDQDHRPVVPAYPGRGLKILLVDHEDSFVHTLSGYLRGTGADTITFRSPIDADLPRRMKPDLAVLSPGPRRPADFAMSRTLELLLQAGVPVFGVCLGLQGIVEYFGGELGRLAVPMHGKPSRIRRLMPDLLFDGLPDDITVGRYHSLYAARLPACLEATAVDDAGIVMALRHRSLPIRAVQFHPESLLSLHDGAGPAMIANLCRLSGWTGGTAGHPHNPGAGTGAAMMTGSAPNMHVPHRIA
ncbi:anthranilate synthase component I [Tistrella bauzanensis]|uniref:Anthranilate synthase n=1 Tax=Tistrella arctica TaxID=3133430 RepID=A0ABU9YDL0_9PROT